jgi:ABC-type antimicrobial peptide transport system permease subunit
MAFVPIAQISDPRPFMDVVIRAAAPLSELSSGVARAVRDVSPIVASDLRAFEATVRQGLVRERLMAALSGFFGVLAVLIAVVGLYGVIAELVTRRRGEIGVRMALGATRTRIVAMVLRQAGTLLVAGLVIGVLLSAVAGGTMRSFVFGVEPLDLEPMAVACACLVAAAMVAIMVPAYRAATLEPVSALREN